jgi:hypothetical protein
MSASSPISESSAATTSPAHSVSSASDTTSSATTSSATTSSASAKTKKSKKTETVEEPDYENECQICCEKLNKSTNKPIVCPITSCSYSACVSCVRTYLLANPLSTPHCMSCKKQFNNMFLVEKLSKIWTNEKYKPHVSSVMVDIEISKLSESMEEAENRKKIAEIRTQIAETKEEFSKAKHKYWTDIGLLNDKLRILEKQKPERKAFIMPCSYNECKGLLSTQYKCGICERFTCKDCQEPNESEHKCNPDNVATAQAIKNDTKPCPSCRTRIYKIEGCDQMWCTSCKTPFSWTTGTIVPAGQRIHNPHAIEFMKQNGINLRAPGDLACGGLITHSQLRNMQQNISIIAQLFNSLSNTNKNANHVFAERMSSFKFDFINSNDYDIFKNIFSNLYTAYIIINEVSLNKLRESREVSQAHHDFNEDRVLYILGKIDKNAFASRIKRHNQNKNVQLELSFVWEIISNFGIDMFNDLYNSSIHSTTTIEHAVAFFTKVFLKLIEFNALIKYVNIQIANVSVANSCTVTTIDYQFNPSNPFYYSLTYIQHGNNRNWTYYGSEPRYLFKSQTFTNTALKKMNS